MAKQILNTLPATLRALTYNTNHLLRSTDLDQDIPSGLASLGQSLMANRADIFQNHPDRQEQLRCSRRYEWSAPGQPQIDNLHLQNFAYCQFGLERWMATLSGGKPIYGDVRQFPHAEQEFLTAQGALSLLVMPIFAKGDWWGFMRFDRQSQSSWPDFEIECVRIAASIVGAAIERYQDHQQPDKGRQAAIGENETHFRTIFEHASIGIIINNKEGQLIDCNQAFQQMTGYNTKELSRLSYQDYTHPDDLYKEHKFIKEMLANQRNSYRLEKRFHCKNGTIKHTHLTVISQRDARQEIIFSIGIVEDIDKCRRMEEHIRRLNTELEQRVQERTAQLEKIAQTLEEEIEERRHAEKQIRFQARLLDMIEQAVITTDLMGKITFWNKFAETLYGWKATEVLGKNIVEVLTPASDKVSQRNIIRRILRKEGWSGEYLACNKCGEVFPIFVSVTIIYNENGKARGIIGVSSDLRERKRAEERIRKSEERANALARMARRVSARIELKDVLEAICQETARSFSARVASVALYDEVNEVFVIQAATGLKKRSLKNCQPIPLAQVERCWPVEAATATLQEYDGLSGAQQYAALGTQTIITRLRHGEQLLGLIILFWQTRNKTLEEENRSLLQAMADQAAAAIANAQLFEQVRAGRERLQVLSKRLGEVQETERRHLARELHDEIGQALTGMQFSLEYCKKLSLEKCLENLSKTQVLVSDLMKQVRNMSLELRPAMLDDLGLLPTLLWFFDRYIAQTGIEVHFSHYGIEQRFASQLETTAYRIVQESLTNVARHAGVNEVWVRVQANESVLQVEVEDHGRGFNLQKALAAPTGGIIGIQDRVSLSGGKICIDAQHGKGSRLTAALPLIHYLERRKHERNHSLSG